MDVRTTGEHARLHGGDQLSLEGLRVGTLGVLHRNVPVFDPAQQPWKAAVTQQVRSLKLSGENRKRTRCLNFHRRYFLNLFYVLDIKTYNTSLF